MPKTSPIDADRVTGPFLQFRSTKAGFRKLRHRIGSELPARVLFEPTGATHGVFEAALAEGLPPVEAIPKHACRLVASRGRPTSTDRADGFVLALIGADHDPETDMPVAKCRPVSRELQVARPAPVKDKVLLRFQPDGRRHTLTRRLCRVLAAKAQSEKWEPVFGINCAQNHEDRISDLIQISWMMFYC
ncbi:MAG: hypothetical protein ACWA5A_14735 [Marinibacterium sp.]